MCPLKRRSALFRHTNVLGQPHPGPAIGDLPRLGPWFSEERPTASAIYRA